MMLKPDTYFSHIALAILVAAVGVASPDLLFADDVNTDDPQRCATIDDDASRLGCYDKASGRVGKAPVVLPSLIEQVADDVGSESLPRQKDKKDEEVSVVARVTECTKDVRKKYIFRLENGQVWKQVSDRRLYFKTCDFNVTISKDFFGYKMQQVDSKLRFRVSRIK